MVFKNNMEDIKIFFEKHDIMKEIKEYCELNNISDVDEFSYMCLVTGFNITRYGVSPGDNIKRQNVTESKVEDTKNDSLKEEENIVKKKRKISIKNIG